MIRAKRAVRGFTLTELAVTMVIFSLFSTSLVATLTLSMSYYRQTKEFVLAEQNARIGMAAIVTEFRQSLCPNTSTSAIITPAAINATANQFVFTEANTVNFNPLASDFNFNSPANFLEVNYFVQNNSGVTALEREVQSFNANGTIASDVTQVVAQSNTGSIALSVTELNANSVSVQIISSEGPTRYVLTTQNCTAIMQ